MAKVFGIHELELKPGAAAEEFERFMLEDVGNLPPLAGTRTYLLKGDRGIRDGKYAFLFEFESQETRDRLAPVEGDPPEDVQQVFASEAVRRALARWATFTTVPGNDTEWTDYVVVS